MKTYMLKTAEIKRSWIIIDAKDRVLGQVATEIAVQLMGKNKPTFTPHIDNGDFVIVLNAKKVVVTGAKSQRKLYNRHSLLPGGITTNTFDQLLDKHPDQIILGAVNNMLPKNKMRSDRLARLKIYEGMEHPHQGQTNIKAEAKTEEVTSEVKES
ncbi:50S ribosomal protein L13 [soil metagenome]